jgi:hypothetical protein
MTLRIERLPANRGTRIRLSGELRCEQLEDVRGEIALSDSPVALDLDELAHVDINAVRFLMACEREGVELMNCSLFIHEWMVQEQRTKGDFTQEAGGRTAERDGQERPRKERSNG